MVLSMYVLYFIKTSYGFIYYPYKGKKMVIKSSGVIGLTSDIKDEFGGIPPFHIFDYYDVAEGIPSAGNIALFDFYGKASALRLSSYQFTEHHSLSNIYNTISNYGRCGIVKTLDGGYIIFSYRDRAKNTLNNNGCAIFVGLNAALQYIGYTNLTSYSNIRSYVKVASDSMKTIPNQAVFAWCSRTNNNYQVHMGLIDRLSNSSKSFVNYKTNIHSRNANEVSSIGVACNTNGNILVAHTEDSSSFDSYFIIKTSSLGYVISGTSLNSYLGSDSRIIDVKAIGTYFYITAYSITNNRYQILKINNNGSQISTIYTLIDNTLSPWHECSSNNSCIISTYIHTVIGRDGKFCILSFNTENNTAIVSGTFDTGTSEINDVFSITYDLIRKRFYVCKDLKIYIVYANNDMIPTTHASTIDISNFYYNGEKIHMASDILYINNDKIYLAGLTESRLFGLVELSIDR